MRFILASASPRRRELLEKIIKEYEVISSDADETITKERPSDIVKELAAKKASSVYDKVKDEGDVCVIGADTIVVYGDEILGKPTDADDARNMLSLLANRKHYVYTGVCLVVKKDGRRSDTVFYERTGVELYPISRYEIDEYIATGEPFDKAGAYGIQGDFAKHVAAICGDYTNIVGLPVGSLYQKMKKAGLVY